MSTKDMFFVWFKLWKFQQFEEMLLWIGTESPLFKSKRCASELFSPVKSRVDWEFWFIDRNISFSFFLVDFQRNTFVSSYRGEIDIFRGNSDLLPESLTWNFHLLPIPGTFVTMVPWWAFVLELFQCFCPARNVELSLRIPSSKCGNLVVDNLSADRRTRP